MLVKDDEALVRVRAAAVNIGDWHLLRGVPYVMRTVSGLLKPRRAVPGLDIAGQVEAVGRMVKQVRPGDEVFGWCRGAFAEYACAGENNLLPKPANLTFEQSAAVGDSAFTALNAVRDQGNVQPGHRVLINGASGGVGTFAVQIAKSFGAIVTSVCSTRNVDMVRSVGADRVIDYTNEDFAETEQLYDVMLDLVGSRLLLDCRRVLAPRGPTSWLGSPTWVVGSGSLVRPRHSCYRPSCASECGCSSSGTTRTTWLSSRASSKPERSRRSSTAGTSCVRCLKRSGTREKDMPGEKSSSPCRARAPLGQGSRSASRSRRPGPRGHACFARRALVARRAPRRTQLVSMKMGVWSSAVSGVVVRARGRGGGGERRSCLYRPFGVGGRG